MISVAGLFAFLVVPGVVLAPPAHAIDPVGEACNRAATLGKICSPE